MTINERLQETIDSAKRVGGRGDVYFPADQVPAMMQAIGDEAQDALTRITDLEAALNLALCYLSELEPPDSRAVSNEFVAIAGVAAGGDIINQECRDVIAAALIEQRK